MSAEIRPAQPPVEVIGFSSRGGAGHQAALNAVKQRVLSKDGMSFDGRTVVKVESPERFKEYDMMGDGMLNDDGILCKVFKLFTGMKLGDYCVNQWNDAQKSGDVEKQRNIVSKQWVAELLFWLIVYFKVKSHLSSLNVPPKVVVSTQALCTSAIAHAILQVNKDKGWNVNLHHYMTDMPTEKSTHFYRSISSIGKNKELRDIYTLHVTGAKSMQAADKEVIRKNCSDIKVEWIKPEDFPIREAFLSVQKLNEKIGGNVAQIKLKLNPSFGKEGSDGVKSETEIIQAGLQGGVSPTIKEGANANSPAFATFDVKNEDKVGFLMLGSQPSEQGVIDWINSMVHGARQKLQQDGPEQKHYFFVFCGAPEVKQDKGVEVVTQNKLLRRVAEHMETLKKNGELPENLNVVPFTFQGDAELAPLMARADLTITRSGGSTCFELIHLHEQMEEGKLPARANRLSLIHAEGMNKGASETYSSQKAKEELIASLIGMSRQDDSLADLSVEEWKTIYQEIEHLAIDNGLTAEQLKELKAALNPSEEDEIEPCKSLTKDHKNTLHSLSEAFKKFLEEKNAIPLTAEEKEKLIVEKMQSLAKQEVYARTDEFALRRIAIQQLLTEQGIPLWEAGNADYLGKVVGAEVSNPEFAAISLSEKFFETGRVNPIPAN